MFRLWTVFTVSLLITACSAHKIDVQQGNVITQEAVEKLKPGMDKRQVAVTVGSPLVNDPFNKDRWDYVYSLRQDGEEVHFSHVILYFKDELLAEIKVDQPPLTEEEVRNLRKPEFTRAR